MGVTDPNATWHSIAEVNNHASTAGFAPGDQILFESGQVFSGTLDLESPDQVLNMGRPDAPITIGSYDPSNPANRQPVPAVISSGVGAGILVFNAAGYHITDLNIQGGWNYATATGNSSDGIIFNGNLGAALVLSYVHIDHVTVSGYGADSFDFNRGNGILFGNVNGIACAYTDVAITDSVIHDGVSNGIYSRAHITNLLLDHDVIYDIYGLRNVNSGYGIHMWNLDGAVIQKCEVFNTGLWGGDPYAGGPDGPGGPVGIDVSNSSHVLIQYNDSHHNHDHAGGDGDGFDLDEHTSDSIMQFNYAHDNDGVGFMLGTWLSNGFNTRNVLRYNVSENDCRYWNYGAILVESPLVTNCEIYNNTVYLSPNAGRNDNFLSAIEIPITGQTVHVRNNLFQTSGGVPTVVVQRTLGSGALFQGNNYYSRGWTPSSSQPLLLWGGGRYLSLDQWRAGTNNSQESLNGMALGTQADPLLSDPGAGGGIDNPLDAHYVPNHIDQLGSLLAHYYGVGNPFPGVDLTRLGIPQWDPFNLESLGGAVASSWVATQDFAGHAFTWGGDTDPHTPGAFQFPVDAQSPSFVILAPPAIVSGMPFAISLEALDPLGNRNAAYTGTVHFTTTDADLGVVLPADYSFTASDAGVHRFDGLTLITPGDQVITVTDLNIQMMGTTTITVADGTPPPGGSAARPPLSPGSHSGAMAMLFAWRPSGTSSAALVTAAMAAASGVAAVEAIRPARPLPPLAAGVRHSLCRQPPALEAVQLWDAWAKGDEDQASLATRGTSGLIVPEEAECALLDHDAVKPMPVPVA